MSIFNHTLEPLRHPVYFLCKDMRKWQDIIEVHVPPPVEEICDRFINSNDVWSVQTYIHLKRRGLDVHLVSEYMPGKICIATYDDISIRDCIFNSYVVACQHDRGRPEICEQRIVQNPLNIMCLSDHYIPHWSQPGLRPRIHSRGARIENVVYKGRAIYLAPVFKKPDFLKRLKDIGVELFVNENDSADQSSHWIDYRTADVVLAIRNCTEYDLQLKPPSKLVNAWLAGVPALLGPEPAYQSLRKSELDYIEVRSPADVLEALKYLKENPQLYLSMIENGFNRAKEFTQDRISCLWHSLLNGSVALGYERWLNQPPLWRTFGRPSQFVWRSVRHKIEHQNFLFRISQGRRLFPDFKSN